MRKSGGKLISSIFYEFSCSDGRDYDDCENIKSFWYGSGGIQRYLIMLHTRDVDQYRLEFSSLLTNANSKLFYNKSVYFSSMIQVTLEL